MAQKTTSILFPFAPFLSPLKQADAGDCTATDHSACSCKWDAWSLESVCMLIALKTLREKERQKNRDRRTAVDEDRHLRMKR